MFIQSILENLPYAWYCAGPWGLQGEKTHEVSDSRRLLSPAGAHVTGTGGPGDAEGLLPARSEKANVAIQPSECFGFPLHIKGFPWWLRW